MPHNFSHQLQNPTQQSGPGPRPAPAQSGQPRPSTGMGGRQAVSPRPQQAGRPERVSPRRPLPRQEMRPERRPQAGPQGSRPLPQTRQPQSRPKLRQIQPARGRTGRVPHPASARPTRPGPQPLSSYHQAQGQPSSEQVLTPAYQALKYDHLIFLFFLLPLLVMGVLFIFWPTEEISQAEQRTLAQRPVFAWSDFYQGKFNADVDAYYADQFPFREQLLDLNRTLKAIVNFTPGGDDQVHLITAQKDGGGQGGVEHPLESQPQETSGAEATEPEATEPPGPQADREIKETEVKLSNQANLDLETSNIVIIKGQAMEIHYYSPEYTEYYAQRINHLRQVLPENRRVISLVAPTAIAFYGTDELRSGDYSNFAAITNIYKHEDPDIFKVDAYSELAAHLDEYIYFRTDHHWNGRGAYYAYKAFCDTLDLEAPALSDYELTRPEGTFLGSLYGYTDKSPLLLGSEDQAEIFQPLHEAEYTYYEDASMSEGYPGTFLAYNVYNENQYMLYLGGDVALGHIKSSLENGKSILVVKDSFGNGFIPYLVDQYEDIYVVDPRQFTDDLLAFIEDKDIQDVLVLNYTFAVSNPQWLDGFDSITGYVEPDAQGEEG